MLIRVEEQITMTNCLESIGVQKVRSFVLHRSSLVSQISNIPDIRVNKT
jgi:hypothetical protein